MARHWKIALGIIGSAIAINLGLWWHLTNPALIHRDTRPASQIFEGFAYAGSVEDTRPADKPGKLAPHGAVGILTLDSRPLPEHLVPGRVYFFHHLRSSDSMEFARRIIAPRLRAAGFQVDETNGDIFESWFDFDERRGGRESFVGWTMRFKSDRCVGELYRDLDGPLEDLWFPVIQQVWEPADYSLTLKGTCDL